MKMSMISICFFILNITIVLTQKDENIQKRYAFSQKHKDKLCLGKLDVKMSSDKGLYCTVTKDLYRNERVCDISGEYTICGRKINLN